MWPALPEVNQANTCGQVAGGRGKGVKKSLYGQILHRAVREMKRSIGACWAHYSRYFGVATFIFRKHSGQAVPISPKVVLYACEEPQS